MSYRLSLKVEIPLQLLSVCGHVVEPAPLLLAPSLPPSPPRFLSPLYRSRLGFGLHANHRCHSVARFVCRACALRFPATTQQRRGVFHQSQGDGHRERPHFSGNSVPLLYGGEWCQNQADGVLYHSFAPTISFLINTTETETEGLAACVEVCCWKGLRRCSEA